MPRRAAVRARAGDGHIAHGAFGGREGIRCAVACRARLCDAPCDKENHHSSLLAFVTLRLVTTVSPHSILSSPSGASGPWRPQFLFQEPARGAIVPVA